MENTSPHKRLRNESSSSPAVKEHDPSVVRDAGGLAPGFGDQLEARFQQLERFARESEQRAAAAEAEAGRIKAELLATQNQLLEATRHGEIISQAAAAAAKAQRTAEELASRSSLGSSLHAPSPYSGAPAHAMDLRALAQLSAQAALTSRPEPFTGSGASGGMAAANWLRNTEYVFRTNEQLLQTSNTPAAEASRVALAVQALKDEARVWYTGLSEQNKEPASWDEFKKLFKARFDSINNAWLVKRQLEELVEAHEGKGNMSMDKLGRYLAQFEHIANRLDDSFLPRHAKLELMARGLPERARKVVMGQAVQEDFLQAKSVSEVAAEVLKKATTERFATSGAKGFLSATGSSSASSAAPPSTGVTEMELSAVELAMKNFGWNPSEAAQHLRDQEGWAPHDTSDSGSDGKILTLTAMLQSMQTDKAAALLCNAFGTHRGRGTVSEGVRKTVPEKLAKAREKAELCIKCGVARFERGGHTARNCKAATDTTTTVAEGRKRAGLPPKDFH